MSNWNCDLLVDYLNGTLSDKEIQEFEEHLKGCDECQEIVEATGELPYLADPVEPPVEMKARILSNVFEEEPSASPAVSDSDTVPAPFVKRTAKRSWWTPLIAAGLLFSLLGNAYALWMLSDREEPGTQTEAAFQSVNLQPSETFEGTATAAVIIEENTLDLVVQADQLEELEGSQVYQVWLLKEGQPIPAGAFKPNQDGEGATHYKLEENIEGWDTIAITREPDTGNEVPEGEIVLSSEL